MAIVSRWGDDLWFDSWQGRNIFVLLKKKTYRPALGGPTQPPSVKGQKSEGSPILHSDEVRNIFRPPMCFNGVNEDNFTSIYYHD